MSYVYIHSFDGVSISGQRELQGLPPSNYSETAKGLCPMSSAGASRKSYYTTSGTHLRDSFVLASVPAGM